MVRTFSSSVLLKRATRADARLRKKLYRHKMKYPVFLKLDLQRARELAPVSPLQRKEGRGFILNVGPKGPIFRETSYQNAYVTNLNTLGSAIKQYNKHFRFIAHILTQNACLKVLLRISRLYEYIRKSKPHGFIQKLPQCSVCLWYMRRDQRLSSIQDSLQG